MERASSRTQLVWLTLGAGLLAGAIACAPTRAPVPEGWRTVRFEDCCALALPNDLAAIPQRDGAANPTFAEFGRPGLLIVFEYLPQAGFPEGRSTQAGWAEEFDTIDGRRAELVSYDTRASGFTGGRTLHLRVNLPDRETGQSAPTPPKGMQLGATVQCLTEADCTVARSIFSHIDFSTVP